jgi:hypothetical protein
MSLAIWGLFKSLYPLFPSTPRHFAPASARLSSLPASSRSPWSAQPVEVKRPSLPSRRALRVTRWVDRDSGSQCAGRMVMSGRIDEVCAELDRLVEQESARELSRPPI